MACILISGYRCRRCNYEWASRRGRKAPLKICPKCRSPYWDRPRRLDEHPVLTIWPVKELDGARVDYKLLREGQVTKFCGWMSAVDLSGARKRGYFLQIEIYRLQSLGEPRLPPIILEQDEVHCLFRVSSRHFTCYAAGPCPQIKK